MQVYGDAEREGPPETYLDAIRAYLSRADAAAGVERHGFLVAALIEAGELAQGLADAAFGARGEADGPDGAADAAMTLAVVVARQVVRSWRAGFTPDAPRHEEVGLALERLAALTLPDRTATRTPEGFAHYAVYPEGYAEITAGLAENDPLAILGIRSIGTTLAAIGAAGAEAAGGEPVPVATVRPIGHPFARRVALASGLGTDWDKRAVAICDEGPGLSGSSMAAAARAVAEAGVPPGQIHLLPSHRGEPGPEADAAVRAVWAASPRHIRPFDELVLRAENPAHRLRTWCEDLVGPLEGDLVDLSGGRWRDHRDFGDTPPPVAAGTERLKFLVRTPDGPWLARFAGLGRTGFAKLDLARRLSAAGFAPEVAGFRHGFLVERWIVDARPLDPARDRPALLPRLAAYLALRATLDPGPVRGADAAALLTMARRNAELGLGPEDASRLDGWEGGLARLDTLARPVAIDARLHAWEWLVTGGSILKADGVDHHAAHDLVGPQDIAWDVAGAEAEFDLSTDEVAGLVAALAAAGVAVSPDLLAFLRPCYAAFQLGLWTLARDAAGERERPRLTEQVEHYARLLRDRLRAGTPP